VFFSFVYCLDVEFTLIESANKLTVKEW